MTCCSLLFVSFHASCFHVSHQRKDVYHKHGRESCEDSAELTDSRIPYAKTCCWQEEEEVEEKRLRNRELDLLFVVSDSAVKKEDLVSHQAEEENGDASYLTNNAKANECCPFVVGWKHVETILLNHIH